jgi:hypothetical protein
MLNVNMGLSLVRSLLICTTAGFHQPASAGIWFALHLSILLDSSSLVPAPFFFSCSAAMRLIHLQVQAVDVLVPNLKLLLLYFSGSSSSCPCIACCACARELE